MDPLVHYLDQPTNKPTDPTEPTPRHRPKPVRVCMSPHEPIDSARLEPVQAFSCSLNHFAKVSTIFRFCSVILCNTHSSHCSYYLVIYSVTSCKLLEIKSKWTWFKLNSNSNSLLFFFKPSQMELVWKLQLLPYSHTNLNSPSGRSRKIGILGNLSGFFQQVWPQ
jgi:hypothetical protein